MHRRWCNSLPNLVDHVSSVSAFVLTALQIRSEASYVGIRERHRRRLGENSHILASFGALCSVVMALLVPQLVHHLGFCVFLVGGTALIVPKRSSDNDGAFAWVGLAIAVIETWLCLREFGDDFYYRVGLTHFSTAATVLIFFSGLGARGAVLYTGALCVMLCTCAPTGILALGICVSCLAQVMLCLVVEVLLFQQLLEAQKWEAGTAIEARRAKFMATICHELKSPLHGIVGLTSSVIEMQEGSVSSTQNRHLTLILSCARRLVDMVTNMMDASVLVQDKQMRLSKDAVQLDKLAADVVTLCGHSRDRTGKCLVRERVSLINAVGPLPEIEADAHRCTQLIYNLVTNALKFTQEGSVEVSGSADEESRTVSLTVADTGIGIAPESLGRIFQPFSQEDETAQRRKCDGLGLGLSICQDVVIRHGGSLTVESIKGLGSRFRIVLPYKMMASAADSSEGASTTHRPASKEARPAERGQLVQGSPPADLSRSSSTDPRRVLAACSAGDLCDSSLNEACPAMGAATSPSTAAGQQHRIPQHPAGGSDEVPSFLECCQHGEGDTSHGVTEPSGPKCSLEHSEATQRDRSSPLQLLRAPSSSSSTCLEPPLITSNNVRRGSPARATLAAATSSAAWPDGLATSCLFPTLGHGRTKVDLDVAHDPADPYHRSSYVSEGIAAGCDNAGDSPRNSPAPTHPAQLARPPTTPPTHPPARPPTQPAQHTHPAPRAASWGHNGGLLHQSHMIESWGASQRGMTEPLWPLPSHGAPLCEAGGVGADLQACSDHDASHDAYHRDAWWNKDPLCQDGQTVADNSPLSAPAIDFQYPSELLGPSRHDSFHREVRSAPLPSSTIPTQSVLDLWELQRRAAHEQLCLRQRRRDEAKRQSSSGGPYDSKGSTAGFRLLG